MPPNPEAPLLPTDDALRTVLYVEDHPVNVLLMEALLKRRPHVRLVVATTGERGWHAALEHRPVLLLIDLRLPDCHGTDLLRRLRTVPELAGVPAVAVTAEDSAESTACFDEVWQKPVDLRQALARRPRLLERRPAAAVVPIRRGCAPDPIPFPAGP